MQIREPADHALVELLVVLDAKARILFAELGERGRELLLLALVRGLDRQAEHRHREIERLRDGSDPRRANRAARRRNGFPRSSRRPRCRRESPARSRCDPCPCSLNRWPTLNGFLPSSMKSCVSFLHRALIDAEHAELADERVVDDLEHVGDHVLARIGHGVDRLGVRAVALEELRRIAFLRIRQELGRERQELLHAGAGAPGREADRHEMSLAQALLERIVQLLAGEARFAVVEIVAHHRLVDLDDLIDDVLVRVGDRREIALAAGLEEAVDDGAAVLRRQVDRQALGAELVADRLDDAFESMPSWSILLTMMMRQRLRCFARSISRRVWCAMPVGGVDDDRAGLDGGERRQRRAARIGRSGRVDEIDVDTARIDRRDRGADRMLAFFFQRIEIRHRRAALDRACRLDCAAGMQQGFEQRGFAGARLACECDIADVVGGVGHGETLR